MSDHKLKIRELLAAAVGKGDGDVALLQEAANLADLHGDPALGLQARIRLITAASASGNPELALVAFSWCLAKLDQLPDQLGGKKQSVLWYYKWVLDSLCEFAQVTLEQIQKSSADMERRYLEAGLGTQPIEQCRAYVSIRLGDIDAHLAARSRLVLTGRTAGSDCLACQTNAAVEFDLEVGDLAAALHSAGPILEGRQSCAEVPCITYATMLLPLLKLGLHDEAKRCHTRGVRQALASRGMLDSAAKHCAYLAVVGKFTKAISIFETSIIWFHVMKRTWHRMIYLENVMVLFEKLTESGDRPVKLKIPDAANFFRDDSLYQPSVVLRALDQTRRQLVDDLNRRNGNDYLTRRHQQFRELVSSIPQPAPAERTDSGDSTIR